MRRLALCALAGVLVTGGCATSGTTISREPPPGTEPGTDPAARLAASRAATAEVLVPDLLDCPAPGAASSRSYGKSSPLAVAFVTPSRGSRFLAAAVPLPDLGNEAAQMRALVDAANSCPGRDIELHVHDDYDLGDGFSMARVCDDILRDERNDLVIARGIPADRIECITDALPTILIGSAPAEQLASGLVTLIGPVADDLIASSLPTLEALHEIEPGAQLGVLHRPADRNWLDAVFGGSEALVASIEFDDTLGCEGLDEAVDRFISEGVQVVVSSLDERCLPAAALALRRLQLQWVLTPLGVGNGDDAISSLSAVGSTLDGALAVTPVPRAAIRDLLPSTPPALGEACTAITANEGEDYEFGIVQYTSIEELCIAVALARDGAQAGGDPEAIVANTRPAQLPLPSNLLGGFGEGGGAARDVVYAQRYGADCACWELIAGPIAQSS